MGCYPFWIAAFYFVLTFINIPSIKFAVFELVHIVEKPPSLTSKHVIILIIRLVKTKNVWI
ncbi:hypothetical protein LRA02_04040 [Lentilactobacillus rapi]|uniref:Uncharacterized protein n=1 Tax=Lentilactobacillus rapi TaxID=481723 RepID=A0A512PK14_9LACO|nr:hypothetical protein LRA02_04040 [Lentilactobacillus rapi]